MKHSLKLHFSLHPGVEYRNSTVLQLCLSLGNYDPNSLLGLIVAFGLWLAFEAVWEPQCLGVALGGSVLQAAQSLPRPLCVDSSLDDVADFSLHSQKALRLIQRGKQQSAGAENNLSEGDEFSNPPKSKTLK